MSDIFFEALADSLKMVPLLLVIYIGIEIAEYWFGNRMRKSVEKAGRIGPLIGAVLGSFPQCGFSVITTALFSQRLVTIGTLLAVYISTSDEAVPIILSNPDKIGIIIPLILTKVLIAVIAGYLVDIIFAKSNRDVIRHIKAYSRGEDEEGHEHGSVADEKACCGHSTSPASKRFNPKEIFLHPLIHTAKIFFFIFMVTFLMGWVIHATGEARLSLFLASAGLFQPVIAALIGLIPNCAASVAITGLFLEGFITYGAAISGLCASAGLGILVLIREEKDKKKVATVIFLLFMVSVVAGMATDSVF